MIDMEREDKALDVAKRAVRSHAIAIDLAVTLATVESLLVDGVAPSLILQFIRSSRVTTP